MTPVIPCLVAFPETMMLLRERLEGLGFRLVAPGEGEAANAPIAFVPVDAKADLLMIEEKIREMRARAPELTVIGLYAGRLRFKVNEAYRAGMNAVYSLPLEEELLLNKIYELVPTEVVASELSYEQLMRINVVELERATSLSFNVYLFLPMNKKILLYLEADRSIDERMIRKFRENPHYSLYIRRSDLKKYLAFCTLLLASGEGGEALESSQRAKQTARRLSGLMGGFFNDETMTEDESRSMLENMKSLVGQLQDESGSKAGLVKSVTKFCSQQLTHYSHAQNVAAYSCLFGLAVGINEPETLRMGGLLHDLGLSDLPTELIGRDLENMSEEESAKYKLHPGGGKYSIESRKLDVPEAALQMVSLHHERPDGSGYPYGKKGDEIPLVAKICAFADEFDKLTSVRLGHRQYTAAAAMRRIAGLDGRPAMKVFEAEIHRPLVDLFLDEATQQNEVSAQVVVETPMVSIEALLKLPKFVKRETAIDAAPATLLASLNDLRSQLDEHWRAV